MENKCPNKAEFRYTWPGKDEAFICQEHAFKMRRIVEAMGMYVQIIPLTPIESEQHTCHQNVK